MMKINRIIALLACTMAFTACQDDMQEGSMLQNKIYSLTGKMSGGSTMSRAQIALGDTTSGNGETAYWNKGDEFTLYQPDEEDNWKESVFRIDDSYSETGQNTSATFSTDTPAEQGSYVAVYPAAYTRYGNILNFNLVNELDFPEGTDPNDVWSYYFRCNMIMKAMGTLSDTGENTVSFKHMMSLVRVTYTNESGSDQPIDQILLSSDNGSIEFTPNPYIDLNDNEISSIGGGDYYNEYGLTTNGLTVKNSDTFDFYLLFCPTSFSLDDFLHIQLNYGNGEERIFRFPISTIFETSNYHGLAPGKRYWFHLTDNGKGLYLSKEYTTDVVTIENEELSLALKDVLQEQNIDVELDSITGFAKIMEMDANSVTMLDIQNPNGQDPLKYTITSLKGIEKFPNLEYLTCRNTGLETCDLSGNTKLISVDFYWNNLTELNLNCLPDLEFVSVGGNSQMTTLDIDLCENLRRVDCRHNGLMTSVTISHPENITELSYGDTQMSFDLTQFTHLETLVAENRGLTSLDLPTSSKQKISQLLVSNNSLTEIDLREYPNLLSFSCSNNQLKTLDLSKATKLSSFDCERNYLDTLDISKTAIKDLLCGSQQVANPLVLKLTEEQKAVWNDNGWSQYNQNVILEVVEVEDVFDVVTIKNSELTNALIAVLGKDTVKIDPDYDYGMIDRNIVLEIEELSFNDYEGTITSLNNGIGFFENLTKLECRNVGLQTCDLSYNTKLTYLDVQSNQLETLDLTGCKSLQQLFCQYNEELESIILDDKAALWNLQAQGTALEELVIPNPKAMNNLLLPAGLQINDWTAFAETYSNLTGLGLEGRNLVGLDIIEGLKGQLSYLNVQHNNLSELDLTEFLSLRQLDCGWNQLKGLNLSENPDLNHLNCMVNQMTELDISPLTNLRYLSCGSQNIEDALLVLKLTSTQKEYWDSDWKNNEGNTNVTIEVSDANQ